MTHESFDRVEKVKRSSDRSFGFVIGAAFLLIGILPSLHAPHHPRWWAIAAAIFFAALAQWQPAVLAPLNKIWQRLGLLLHRIVSPVILGLLFYTTILPVGVLMRAFGNDPMRRKFDPSADSYWVLREPPGASSESMTQQF